MRLQWKKVLPALVFVHIPVSLLSLEPTVEQETQHRLSQADVLAPLPSAGDHDDEPDPAMQGFLNNTYTGRDLPFWNALVDMDGGHGTSWCARATASSGIPICFNGHSGYGGYVTEHSAVRNGRVFGLNLRDLAREVPVVRTWNSYENGTVNEEVVLGPDYMPEFN
ncbi:hypothetical protein B0H14DRAFT_3443548 [Mycena olivaceomarginata]|nr:hypothetical protein B0H14DRAFT_3443548 [Mycena olivaceomarginata]